MGGAVAVTVRDWDGEIHKMTRWTNSLTYWFQAPHFFDGDREHLQKYIDGAADSMYNVENANLAPDGYGIVVVDCVNKKIISCQGYTSMSRIYSSVIYMEINGCILRGGDEDPRCQADNAALEFHKRGHLAYEDLHKKIKNTLLDPDADIIEMSKDYCSGLNFIIGPPGWSFYEFDDTLEGFKQCYGLIKNLFDLTKEDEESWKNCFNYYSEEEED